MKILMLIGLVPEVVKLMKVIRDAIKGGDNEKAQAALNRALVVQAFRAAQIAKRKAKRV